MSDILASLSPHNWPWDAKISFFLQILSQIYIYGFTSSNSLFPRYLGLLVMIAFTAHFLLEGVAAISDTSAFVGMAAWSIFTPFRYAEVALYSRWDFEHQGPTMETRYSQFPERGRENGSRKLRENGSFKQRAWFGFWSSTALRDVNLPWHVKDIPGFSSKDPQYVPPRRKFLISAGVTSVVAFLVVDFLKSLPAPTNKVPFGNDKIPVFSRLGEVTLREVTRRLAYSGMIWLLIYCSILFRMSVGSFVMVLSGYHQPKGWPAFIGGVGNGSLGKAYTVRGFWGDLWHQSFRKLLLSKSYHITHTILRLPLNSILARYAKIFFTFFQSGIIHHLYDWAGGVSFNESGSMRFYCTQVLGIVIEDAVQALYRSASGRKKGDRTPVLAKVVGYLWTVSFLLIWSSPAWFWPQVRSEKGDYGADLLPFSVFGKFAGS